MLFSSKHWFSRLFETRSGINSGSRRVARLKIEALEDRVTPAIDWTNATNNSLWSDPGNWLDNGQAVAVAPGGNEDVNFDDANIISTSSGCIVDANAAGVVSSIIVASNYVGTITLQQSLTVTGAFDVAGGEFAGAYPIYANAGGNWTGGILSGTGNPETSTLVIAENQDFGISGNVSLAGRVIQNSGAILLGTTTVTASAGGYINNLSTGTFRQNDGVGTLTGQGHFFNYGLVQAAAGTTMNLSVPVTIYQGTFDAEWLINGDGLINFNASVTILGGTPSEGKAATFVGRGQVFVNADFSVTANSASTVADFRFFSAPSITSTFAVTGGLAKFLTSTTLTGNLTIKSGGTVQLAAPLTASGSDALIAVLSGGNLIIRNGLTLDEATLTNANSVLWVGGDLTLDNGASIATGGTFNVDTPGNDPTLPAPTPIGSITGDGTGSFTNTGTLEVWVSATIGFTFVNQGNMLLGDGILTVEGNLTQNAGTSTTFSGGDLWVTGNFTNDGNIRVLSDGHAFVDSLTNNGALLFLGTLAQPRVDFTVSPSTVGGGNLTQGANATLSMKLTANNSNDQLTVSGVATLAGTLNVTIPATVNINANQSWTIITGTRQGQFAAPANQPAGFSAPTYNNNSVAVQNPQMNCCGPQNTNQNVAVVFSAANNNLIDIPVAGGGAAQLELTMTATNGTFTLSTISGLSFSFGDGTNDTTMTFTGTIDAINAALNGLTFTPSTDHIGLATLAIDVADTPASGGDYSDTALVPISVGLPFISSISPNTGITSGEYYVTITGTGFSDATMVYFGSTSASFGIVSDTEITVTVPAGEIGTVDVTVVSENGTSLVLPGCQFSYINSAPHSINNTVYATENQDYQFKEEDFYFSDSPSEYSPNLFDAIVITSLPPTGYGVLKYNGVAVTVGQVILVSDLPNLTYTPPPNTYDTAYTSFTYKVRDDGGTENGGEDTAENANTITIDIWPGI